MNAVAETVSGVTAQVPVRTRYAPGHPVDIVTTLGPLFRSSRNPTCRRDAGGVWLTQRTPHGAVTLRLTQRQSEVDAIAWGTGAAWAIERVPELLGGDDDWAELDVTANIFLTEARRRSPGLRLLNTGLVRSEERRVGKECRARWSAY